MGILPCTGQCHTLGRGVVAILDLRHEKNRTKNHSAWFRVKDLGFMVSGLGFRVYGFGFGVAGLDFRV